MRTPRNQRLSLLESKTRIVFPGMCWSRESVVRQQLGHSVEGGGTEIQMLVLARGFPLLHRVHIGSGPHPAFCSMGNVDSFPRGEKRPMCTWPLIPSIVEVQKEWQYISKTHTPSLRVQWRHILWDAMVCRLAEVVHRIVSSGQAWLTVCPPPPQTPIHVVLHDMD
jgi:hypothetical protein